MYSFQEDGKRIDSCRFFRSFFVLDSSQIHHPCLSTQFQFNSLREQILNNSFQLNSPQLWANSNSIQILWQNSFWILFWGIELELIHEFESICTGQVQNVKRLTASPHKLHKTSKKYFASLPSCQTTLHLFNRTNEKSN